MNHGPKWERSKFSRAASGFKFPAWNTYRQISQVQGCLTFCWVHIPLVSGKNKAGKIHTLPQIKSHFIKELILRFNICQKDGMMPTSICTLENPDLKNLFRLLNLFSPHFSTCFVCCYKKIYINFGNIAHYHKQFWPFIQYRRTMETVSYKNKAL